MQIGGSVDLSTLAHVSEGYTAGSIYRSVKATLTPRRVHRIAKRPLLSSEFLGVLAQQQQLLKKDARVKSCIADKRIWALIFVLEAKYLERQKTWCNP